MKKQLSIAALRSLRHFWLNVAIAIVAIAVQSSAHAADSQQRASGRIEEGKFVALGGIEQWITIRGDHRNDPVLLILHGGPAESQSPLLSTYAAWEKKFIVVQWDQRGAGKTFGRNGAATPEMTLARMTQDVIELAQYLRGELHRDKIILLGHSWGAFLGVHAVKQRPELFAAFVGTGQVESWHRTVELQYAYTMERARATDNKTAVEELTQLGPPPYQGLKQYAGLRKWLNSYSIPSDVAWPPKQYELYRAALSAEELQQLQAGAQFSLPLLMPTLFSMDLPALGLDFKVPFFVIQGKEDRITPTDAAAEYLQQIKAPRKQLLLIPDAGHFAAMTHGEEFLADLLKLVKPLRIARGDDTR